jgi:hypothetical protein
MPRPTGPRRNPSVLRAPTVVNGADSTYRPIAGHVVADVLSGADRGVASLRQHLEARRAGAGDSDQLDPHYPALAEKPLTAIHWSLAVSMGNVQVSANSVPLSDLPSDSAPRRHARGPAARLVASASNVGRHLRAGGVDAGQIGVVNVAQRGRECGVAVVMCGTAVATLLGDGPRVPAGAPHLVGDDRESRAACA